jgi:hypothetical protein
MYIARAAQYAKLRLIIPALAVAIAALIVPLSQIASAHAATRAATSGGPKPTIVLEHGAWANTADHAIPLALQLAMAKNAHAHITEVNAPHLSMISDPGVVTSVILQAVRATT